MTQYRIQFTNITAFGNKKASTVWMNSIEEIKASRWINEPNAEVITRIRPELPKSFSEFKNNQK